MSAAYPVDSTYCLVCRCVGGHRNCPTTADPVDALVDAVERAEAVELRHGERDAVSLPESQSVTPCHGPVSEFGSLSNFDPKVTYKASVTSAADLVEQLIAYSWDVAERAQSAGVAQPLIDLAVHAIWAAEDHVDGSGKKAGDPVLGARVLTMMLAVHTVRRWTA